MNPRETGRLGEFAIDALLSMIGGGEDLI